MSQNLEQSRHAIEPFDIGNIAHVPSDNGPDIIARPGAAPFRPSAPQHFRVSAGEHSLYEILANQEFARLDEPAQECSFEEAGAAAAHLGLRQRQQVDDLHAARQALGNPGKSENVGRPGEQKSSRAPVPVHFPLNGPQQLRRALHLVYREGAGSAHQAGGIAEYRGQNGIVVQRQELAAPRHQVARSPESFCRTGERPFTRTTGVSWSAVATAPVANRG